jgi:uncharacterized protein (TIGR03437 family)
LAGGAELRATLLDLAEGGSRIELAGTGQTAFRVSRPGSLLVAEPQQLSLEERGVLNAATFTEDVAPGGLISIFGSGLAREGTETKVQVGGRAATVVAALPFQVNAQVPAQTPPGSHVLRVESSYGAAEQAVEIRDVAPALFRFAGDPRRGLVVNGDGALNSSASPAARGSSVVVYATGLGATLAANSLAPVQNPVVVLLGGQSVRVSYAGMTPGFVGLYQVNAAIPLTFPPGANVPLVVRQGSAESLPVEISVQ